MTVGLDVRPDLVLFGWVGMGCWCGWVLFFLEVVLSLVLCFGLLVVLVAVFVGRVLVCDAGSQSVHFHILFGLSVWFWKSAGVRFVHFACVHLLQLEHSIDWLI